MTSEQERRRKFIKGLRDFADFLESAPDAPLKLGKHTFSCKYWGKDESHIAKMVKFLGTCEKFENPETIGVRRKFGPIVLQLGWNRYSVCQRIKVGIEQVQEFDYNHMKTVEKPIYEYKCPKTFLNACCE